MRLHNRMAELLEQKGRLEHRKVPLTEVAKKTGIHRTNLYRWMHDDEFTTVDAGHVVALCTYFLCRLERLLYLK